jgi:zinc transport system substrate-binding protein
MNGSKIQIWMLVVMTMVFAAVCGCIGEDNTGDGNEAAPETGVSGAGEERITVAVSILPQQEFVEKIGGDKVKTVLMIPPGASPATHEPTPGQLQEIAQAQLYAIVGSGLPFEKTWLETLKDTNPDMIIVDCSEGIQLREMETGHSHDEEAEEEHGEEGHTHEGNDPHIWNSPVNAEIMVNNICDALVEFDPENEEYYEDNRDSYLTELDDLDSRIRSSLEGKEGSYIMVFHPAWGYFTDEYGLHMLSIEIEGKEPSAQEMTEIIDEAKEHGIKAVFVQSQFSTTSAEAIAEEIDGKVVQIDPLAKDYIENVDYVTTTIAEATE